MEERRGGSNRLTQCSELVDEREDTKEVIRTTFFFYIILREM